MAKVIRVVAYEGSEESIRAALARSLPLGIKDCHDYTITVGEHFSDLAPLPAIDLTGAQIIQALMDTAPSAAERKRKGEAKENQWDWPEGSSMNNG